MLSLITVIILFCSNLCLLIVYWKQFGSKRRHNVPPGPMSYPIIGNLLQLRSSNAPDTVLDSWHCSYGDVYRIQLGSWPCVVVNGYKSVHETLVTKGSDFADRPPFESFKQYAGGCSISFHAFNQVFVKHRRIASRSLAAVLYDQNFKLDNIINRELESLLVKLDKLANNTIGDQNLLYFNPRDIVFAVVGSILYSVCFGYDKQLEKDQEYLNLILAENPTTELFAIGNHLDLFPTVFKYFSKYRTKDKEHSTRMDKMVIANNKKISQHLNKKCNNFREDSEPDCVMDSLLASASKLEPEFNMDPSLQQVLSSTIEFISAGVDTSSSTLLWLLLYMAKYPEIQDQVYKELLENKLTDTRMSYKYRNYIPYTEACMWEVMRLNTIVPFALPHYSLRDSTINGYDIKKGTLIFVNLKSVCRDPTLWHNPDEFQPERFLMRNADSGNMCVNRQKVEQFLPFSAGARRCIGEKLGKLQIFCVFTAVLGRYKLHIRPGTEISGEYGDVSKPKSYEIAVEHR